MSDFVDEPFELNGALTLNLLLHDEVRPIDGEVLQCRRVEMKRIRIEDPNSRWIERFRNTELFEHHGPSAVTHWNAATIRVDLVHDLAGYGPPECGVKTDDGRIESRAEIVEVRDGHVFSAPLDELIEETALSERV